jgi:transcriptional regulator with XRE-family HTH domain
MAQDEGNASRKDNEEADLQPWLCPQAEDSGGEARFMGEQLRVRRMALGISDVSLAKIAGMTPQQIRLYETGLQWPTAADLCRLADVLQVGIDYFFTRPGSQGIEQIERCLMDLERGLVLMTPPQQEALCYLARQLAEASGETGKAAASALPEAREGILRPDEVTNPVGHLATEMNIAARPETTEAGASMTETECAFPIVMVTVDVQEEDVLYLQQLGQLLLSDGELAQAMREKIEAILSDASSASAKTISSH